MAPGKRECQAFFFLQIVTLSCTCSSGEKFDGSKYDRTETRGNSTFGCSFAGTCAPCSYSEKSDDETYHCSTTGYRQSYRCVELESIGLNGDAVGDEATYDSKEASRGRQSQDISKRGLHEAVEALYGWANRKVLEEEDTTVNDGRQVLHIYSSCVPTNGDEKLSVLGFEGIMLGLLALSAPILHHRKKRNFTVAGMSRLPTSARF